MTRYKVELSSGSMLCVHAPVFEGLAEDVSDVLEGCGRGSGSVDRTGLGLGLVFDLILEE